MIRVPGDKSVSHRTLLASVLAEGKSRLTGVLPGEDCRSTARVLRQLGADVPDLPRDGSSFQVEGRGLRSLRATAEVLDCGNSGTTARLLLGLLTGLSIEATLTGDASLRSRPMARVSGPLELAGARFREEGAAGRLPLRVLGGRLDRVRHRSSVASAQVKSALLLAGIGQGVPVEVIEPVPSRDHTERLLRRMGVPVRASGKAPHSVALPAGEWRLSPIELLVPGDVSSAAFLLALGALGGAGEELTIGNVGLNPTRTGLLDVLERMGATIERDDVRESDDPAGEPAGNLTVRPVQLTGVEVGGETIPSLIDEVPILAVAAARASGTTVIRDAAELRVKESDRLHALATNLRAVGAEVEELPDGLVVEGSDRPLEGRVKVFHDHRIAMAFGILGALPGNRIELDDPSVVDVSFPGFWELLERLAPRSEGTGAGAATSPGTSRPGVRPPVVTIDGPAASGKSSTARAVADRLGFRHLDSGAIYRALTLALLRADIPEDHWEREGIEHLRTLRLSFVPDDGHFRLLVDGEDAGEALRAPEVTAGVSRLAAIPAARELVVGLQREAALPGGVVAEGRDMGSVVLPDAEVRVFLTASIEERARRRLLQEGHEPTPESLKVASAELEERDRRDRERRIAPLRRPEGAVELDTTETTPEEQAAWIEERVREAVRRRERGNAP